MILLRNQSLRSPGRKLFWAPFVLLRTSRDGRQNGRNLPFIGLTHPGASQAISDHPGPNGAMKWAIDGTTGFHGTTTPIGLFGKRLLDQSRRFAVPLKDLQIRNLRPTEKIAQYADERGLYLEVHPNGSMLWRYKYRYFGKQKRLALGRYPDVGLADARRRRDDARRTLEAGSDPLAERKHEKLVAAFKAANIRSCEARNPCWDLAVSSQHYLYGWLIPHANAISRRGSMAAPLAPRADFMWGFTSPDPRRNKNGTSKVPESIRYRYRAGANIGVRPFHQQPHKQCGNCSSAPVRMYPRLRGAPRMSGMRQSTFALKSDIQANE